MSEDRLAIYNGTWNVKTIDNKIDLNKMNLLTYLEFQKHTGQWLPETFARGEHVISQSCRAEHIYYQGIAVMLNKYLAKEIKSYKLINERIMVVQLKSVQLTSATVYLSSLITWHYHKSRYTKIHSELQKQIKPPRKSSKIFLGTSMKRWV